MPNKKTGGFTLTPKFFGVTLRSKGGFTLIETLVAVTILTLAAAGPLALAAKSLATAALVKNQTTAFYLGQEALETVTNIRDYNYLTQNGPNQNWLLHIEQCVDTGPCTIDPQANVGARLRRCPSLDPTRCERIKYDRVTGFWGHDAGTASIFTRYIEIDRVSSQNPDEIRITANVTWREGTRNRKLIFVKNLYDWR